MRVIPHFQETKARALLTLLVNISILEKKRSTITVLILSLLPFQQQRLRPPLSHLASFHMLHCSFNKSIDNVNQGANVSTGVSILMPPLTAPIRVPRVASHHLWQQRM